MKSKAAGVLLRHKLIVEDVEDWLRFKEEIFSKYSKLICSYCQRDDLKRDSKKKKTLATIDHIVAISKGGAEKNETNVCIACWPCNHDKDDKPLDEWRVCDN